MADVEPLFTGVIPALLTPFTKDGAVDTAAVPVLINHLIDKVRKTLGKTPVGSRLCFVLSLPKPMSRGLVWRVDGFYGGHGTAQLPVCYADVVHLASTNNRNITLCDTFFPLFFFLCTGRECVLPLRIERRGPQHVCCRA